MGIIRELKEEVYRKIAAGEVVERPASVVKELVENAIDADARRISVELQRGGKEMIRVTDDGHGFAPEDIELAFRNHSTSKLQELSDLDHLSSLGFRGEALPSIGEVSRVEIKTADSDSGSGMYCRLSAGTLEKKTQTACRKGTQITVKELFYNFPVRRKFLKTDRTELNRITDLLERIALIQHSIGFSLVHDQRELFDFGPTDSFADRVYQVLGSRLFQDMQPLDFSRDRVRLNGFISKLNTGSPVKKHQYYYVNQRPVREPAFIAAVNNTFSPYLSKGRYPVSVLSLTLPAGDVDVNIHPMKQEIKFRDTSFVYGFVKSAVESRFRSVSPTPEIPLSPREPAVLRGSFPPPEPGIAGPSPPLLPLAPAASYSLLGQYHDSFIVVQKDRKLLIIDQHNAHERINYEKLIRMSREEKGMGIAPLFPVIIELTPAESRNFTQRIQGILKNIGFDIRRLSGNSIDVKSYPWFVEEGNIRDIIVSVLHLQLGEHPENGKIFADIACRNAIKVNHPLQPAEMKTLVDDLFATQNPYFCPHQRPIIKEWTLEDIEKMLKRR